MSFLQAVRRVVGEEFVVTDEALTAEQRTLIPQAHRAQCLARPATVEEVQALLRTAREHQVSVWPVSRGRNWGYGSRTPSRQDALVMSLDRMNRILEVNEELAYAVVEPGVTFWQLNQHLKATGSRLWTDPTDSTPHGSVVGNALERGVGETPYGDHFGNLCGLEFVTPEGEVLRTGGGPENLATWHTYKWGTGPFVDGLLSQGNFGVVTRAGVWLMPEPECFELFTFQLDDEADLPRLIDTLRELQLQRVFDGKLHLSNLVCSLSIFHEYPWDLVPDGRRCLDAQGRRAAADRFKLPAWTFAVGLHGCPGEVAAKRRAATRALAKLGRTTVVGPGRLRRLERFAGFARRHWQTPVLGGVLRGIFDGLIRRSLEVIEGLPDLYHMVRGVPTERFLSMAYLRHHKRPPPTDRDPARDGCGMLWFAPVIPYTGEHLRRLEELCWPRYAAAQFDPYMAILAVNPRSLVPLMAIHYDREDPEDAARAEALYRELRAATLAAGYQQYRSRSPTCDDMLDVAPGLRDFLDRMKAAVDPAGILAPGRYGVGAKRRSDEAGA